MGVCGGLIISFGFMVVFMNEVIGPRLVGKPFGLVGIAVGLMLMLLHAIRDNDSQIRRTYGFFAYSLLGLALVLLLPNTINFLKYGWECILAALCFLLAVVRHETDRIWHERIRISIGLVGIVLAVIGFAGSIIGEDFLLSYGLLAIALGLAYLCSFISLCDPTTDHGYRAGLAIVLWRYSWFFMQSFVRPRRACST